MAHASLMSYLNTRTDSHGVTTIELNRPETYNAMDRHFFDELTTTINELKGNTRVLVLTGTGKHFCAGADIQWMKQSAELSDEENRADAMALSNMLEALNTFTCPTIAKVHGAALGGGTGIVSCCDIVVASEDARFAFSEVRLGIIPATISPYAIAAIGARAARRYFLTGEQFDAMEAYRLGLVHDVCSTGNLDHSVNFILESLFKGGPSAQYNAKQLIMDVAGQDVTDKLREELSTRLARVRTSPEAQEGLGAFLNKRSAEWPA